MGIEGIGEKLAKENNLTSEQEQAKKDYFKNDTEGDPIYQWHKNAHANESLHWTQCGEQKTPEEELVKKEPMTREDFFK